MEYTVTQLIGMIFFLIVCPCSIIATVTGCIIWYKKWEARDFKSGKKESKERRQLNG